MDFASIAFSGLDTASRRRIPKPLLRALAPAVAELLEQLSDTVAAHTAAAVQAEHDKAAALLAAQAAEGLEVARSAALKAAKAAAEASSASKADDARDGAKAAASAAAEAVAAIAAVAATFNAFAPADDGEGA